MNPTVLVPIPKETETLPKVKFKIGPYTQRARRD